MIAEVIQRYHPTWVPPKDTGASWSRCLCPFHPDSVESGAVNYGLQAYNCLGCGVGGSPVHIIQLLEGVSYREAARIAEELSEGSYRALPPKPAKVSRRRLPSVEGAGIRVADTRDEASVPARVRRRPPPRT